jgi:hypothetical protein
MYVFHAPRLTETRTCEANEQYGQRSFRDEAFYLHITEQKRWRAQG